MRVNLSIDQLCYAPCQLVWQEREVRTPRAWTMFPREHNEGEAWP